MILNNVAQGRHETRLRRAIEQHCGLPVLGALPRSDEVTIPDRHLGLVPLAEGEGLLPALAACRTAQSGIDLSGMRPGSSACSCPAGACAAGGWPGPGRCSGACSAPASARSASA